MRKGALLVFTILLHSWALFVFFSSFVSASPQADPENTVIVSGIPWYDIEGNRIEGHGLGMLVEDGGYYWYGTSKKQGTDWLSTSVTLYTSSDLKNWKFEGDVFTTDEIKMATPPPYRMERAKVLHNPNTGKYVMWFHLDTPDFQLKSCGVAVSDNRTGPFSWVGGFQPDNLGSLDMTLFQDKDGTAYIVRSVENEYTGFTQLSMDYLTTVGGIISKGPRIEGQCVWTDEQGTYWLLGSHLTGWAPNPAVLCRGKDAGQGLRGMTWEELGNPSNDDTTFNSQSTWVLPYVHEKSKKILYIYLGDRWNQDGPGSVGNSTYVWLPMDPTNQDIPFEFSWHSSWTIGDY